MAWVAERIRPGHSTEMLAASVGPMDAGLLVFQYVAHDDGGFVAAQSKFRDVGPCRDLFKPGFAKRSYLRWAGHIDDSVLRDVIDELRTMLHHGYFTLRA